VVAFRVNHFHPPDDAPDVEEGSVLLEIGARLPGTEAELVVPLEMSPETVIGLIDELVHQFRCLEYGFADDDEDAEEQ
jgi:hypothetical protein